MPQFEKKMLFSDNLLGGSPLRPNHIGMSVVKLVKVAGNKVFVEGVDILDGTPLLDIKPYIEKFDAVKEECSSGWLQADDEEIRKKTIR